MGLMNFLFGRRRDGTTPMTAVVVNSIAEEYRWMQEHFPGFRPEKQTLTHIDGKPFDVLTWQNDRGEKRTVFFDISRFFGR